MNKFTYNTVNLSMSQNIIVKLKIKQNMHLIVKYLNKKYIKKLQLQHKK